MRHWPEDRTASPKTRISPNNNVHGHSISATTCRRQNDEPMDMKELQPASCGRCISTLEIQKAWLSEKLSIERRSGAPNRAEMITFGRCQRLPEFPSRHSHVPPDNVNRKHKLASCLEVAQLIFELDSDLYENESEPGNKNGFYSAWLAKKRKKARPAARPIFNSATVSADCFYTG